jgi:hypothetical protein
MAGDRADERDGETAHASTKPAVMGADGTTASDAAPAVATPGVERALLPPITLRSAPRSRTPSSGRIWSSRSMVRFASSTTRPKLDGTTKLYIECRRGSEVFATRRYER